MTSHSKLISSFPKLYLPGYVLKSCFLLCPETLWCIINSKPQEVVLLLILGDGMCHVCIRDTHKSPRICSTTFPKSGVSDLWNLWPFTERKSCTDKCFSLSDIKCVCYCSDLGRWTGKRFVLTLADSRRSWLCFRTGHTKIGLAVGQGDGRTLELLRVVGVPLIVPSIGDISENEPQGWIDDFTYSDPQIRQQANFWENLLCFTP